MLVSEENSTHCLVGCQCERTSVCTRVSEDRILSDFGHELLKF